MAILTSDIRLDLLSVLLALISVIIAYFKWKYMYWKRKGVQTPPASIPFGNTTSTFLRKINFGTELKRIYNEYKAKGLRYCGIYLMARPVLLIFDPDLIKSIMTKDFQHFTDHASYVNEKNDPLSGHLFSLKGLKWKTLRAKLTPTFTSGNMKMMFQTLVDCSDELLVTMGKLAEDNKVVDIKDVVVRFSTDIIGSCAFGLECQSMQNPDSEFRHYGKKVFEGNPFQAVRALFAMSFPELMDFLKLPLFSRDVSNFFMDIVKETVNYREKNNVVRKDFMHLLIQLKNNVNINENENVEKLNGLRRNNERNSKSEVGKSLTIEELAAQAFLFFIAGFEASSTTLTFCFYELVSNSDIQDKLRDEINDVLAKHDNKITYEALTEMTYMEKCINETLRKYPPLSFLNRVCTQKYQIPHSSLILKEGDAIFIPILGIQHDAEYHPDPEKFDPERFSAENKAERDSFTWLPFGEGPRLCIAPRFGMMQTKVALTVLLRNFSFYIHSKTKVPLVFDPKNLLLNVEGGLWLTAKKIN